MLKFEPPGPSHRRTQPQRHSSAPLVILSGLSPGFKRLTLPSDAGAPCLSCSHCLVHLPGAAVPARGVQEAEAHDRHRGRGFRTMETLGCPGAAALRTGPVARHSAAAGGAGPRRGTARLSRCAPAAGLGRRTTRRERTKDRNGNKGRSGEGRRARERRGA